MPLALSTRSRWFDAGRRIGASAALALIAALMLAARPAARSPQLAADLTRLQTLRRQRDFAASESLAVALLARLEHRPDADSLAIADALVALTQAYQQRQLVVDTVLLPPIQRAAGIRRRHLPPDDPGVAEAESYLGSSYGFTGPLDSALAHSRRALEIRLRQPTSDTLLADSWFDVGSIESQLGHGPQALDALQHALELVKRAYGPHDNTVATVLSMVGEAWVALHEVERGRDCQEQAIAFLDRSGHRDDNLRGAFCSRLADDERALGDVSRAYDAAQAGLRATEAESDSADRITARFNVGVMLGDLGDDAGAHAVYAAVLPMCEQHYGSHWLTGRVRQVLGSTCAALGDTATAMRLYHQSEADLEAHPDPGGSTVSLSYEYEAEVLHRQGHDAEALRKIERGIELSGKAQTVDPGVLATTRSARIRILESLSDTTALAAARRDLAAVRDRLGMDGGRMGPSIAYWLASADRALGRPAAWDEALAAEAQARDRLQWNVETLPDDRALELAARKSYVLSQVLDMADAAHPDRWEPAWDRLVRTRGMVRADLERRRLPATLAGDTALVRSHDDWVAARLKLARRLVRGGRRDSSALAALDLLRRRADGAEIAYARAVHARGVDTVRVVTSLAAVRARLRPDQALVGCAEVQGRDEVTRMIAYVTRGGASRISRVELGRSDDLASLIAPWRERLATSPGAGAPAGDRAEATCRRLGERVRSRTWDRLAPAIAGAAEVLLAGDGPLADLPWQALPVGTSRYLVEQGPLLRRLDAERELLGRPDRAVSGSPLVAFGDPDFELAGHAAPVAGEPLASGGLRSAPDPCAAGAPHFTPLPGTAAETEVVAGFWNARGRETMVRRGAHATESAFRELAPRASVLHLATHGIVVGDACRAAEAGTRGIGGIASVAAASPAHVSPSAPVPPAPMSPWLGRRVWLALAGANHARDAERDDDDGILTAEEVVTLDLSGVDWVVLSACHSGLAQSWAHEGTLGMGRAFQLAGAHSVIASDWAIADDATVDWMRALYQARDGGSAGAAEAVRAACRSVLAARRRAGRTTHPFYWAAFSARGE